MGAYAGAQLGVVAIKMGTAYTQYFIGTSRSIVLPGVNDAVTASYQAGTAQAFFEISKDFDVQGVTVSPFGKFLAVSHATDAFTEAGGAGGTLAAADVAVLSGGLVFDISDAMNPAVNHDGMLGARYGSSAFSATPAGRF
jgi:uncharacterized protein with beta-barrel porin domain